MKTMKKILCLVMALAMIAALGVSAFADNATTGSITVDNPSNGVTYTLYKIFDATIAYNDKGEAVGVQYTATTDQYDAMKDAKAASGNTIFAFTPVTAADGTVTKYYVTLGTASEAEVITYLTGLASVAADGTITCSIKDAAQVQDAKTAATSDATIAWTGLGFGYYIVFNNMEKVAADNGAKADGYNGTAVTIDTTYPDVIVSAKNDYEPITNLVKTDGRTDHTYAIGETVTYTVTFNTTNYDTNNKPIYKYEIIDTLPSFLASDSVTVKSVKVDGSEVTSGIEGKDTFGTNKNITIQWVDDATYAKAKAGTRVEKGSYTFKYEAGAKIEITYTARVTDAAVVQDAGNTNRVDVNAYPFDPGTDNIPDVWNDHVTDTIYTYAAGFKKVDKTSGEALSGATFQFTGYTLSDPTVVYAADGTTEVAVVYTVTGVDATAKPTVTTGESGVVIIRGILNQKLTLTEISAPSGYNLMKETKELTPIKTGEQKVTRSEGGIITADGTVLTTYSLYTTTSSELIDNNGLAGSCAKITVENARGVELPSTGGMGTTMFYVIGGILVIGAGVLLVTKKRMSGRA